jgi:PHD/YefM family antitoxin component YafN of YafNO toxin-antitoxin module
MLLNFEHISKDGIDYVLVPEKDFKAIQEELEDADDLRYLRTARKENEGKAALTYDQMMKELGLEE